MMMNPPHTEKILRSSVGIMEVCKIYYSNHFALCMYQPIYQEFYFIICILQTGKRDQCESGFTNDARVIWGLRLTSWNFQIIILSTNYRYTFSEIS